MVYSVLGVTFSTLSDTLKGKAKNSKTSSWEQHIPSCVCVCDLVLKTLINAMDSVFNSDHCKVQNVLHLDGYFQQQHLI